ncbi:polysaccharide lyase family 8 super-sandwich domain-containing protein [Polaribacter sp.]|uniref:polysaccharide lyase family 8 super-sandwich domain-containing protein n=1 Tax=Polaribacter sp. TaxID=1920175 RepID=UPI0025EA8383|nr:polysaccharide lyase family 8 super-sandwich domain-containing protein [Polaribacter sp.]
MIKKYFYIILITIWSCNNYPQTEYETIIQNIQTEAWGNVSDVTLMDAEVTNDLTSINTNGSWTEIDYNDTTIPWEPFNHLKKLRNFSLAYTLPSSTHYKSTSLFNAIEKALEYWDIQDPQTTNNNWWNIIGTPKELGLVLVILRAGEQNIEAALETNLTNQMNRGDIYGTTGANQLDIAIHFLYRGVLKESVSITNTAVTQAFLPIKLSSGSEELQHDFSFRQHGPQMAIFSYGRVFIEGEISMAYRLRGTSYAIPASKLDLLVQFTNKTVLNILRGQHADFSTIGRGVTRNDLTFSASFVNTLKQLKLLDPENSNAYDAAIARLEGSQPASYMVNDNHTQYWRSDFALHNRSGYSFSVRSSSTKVEKTEHINGENLKGNYLADGGNCIMVDGDEYYNIFPVWDWSKIPGTTIPAVTSFPLPERSGVLGKSTFSGGVSDGIYGIKTYYQTEYKTFAKKGWFFFDDEVVCLGSEITSTASQTIASTLNQSHLDGSIIVSENGDPTTLNSGLHTYNNTADWLLHDNIGYFFPSGGQLNISNQAQSGSWKSINNLRSDELITEDVFKLWLDHGVQPTNSSYAYIVVPNKTTVAEMQNYDQSTITILENSNDIQAVRHNDLNLLQIIFYKAGVYHYDSVKIQVDKRCVMMLKNIGTPEVTIHVADPSKSSTNINAYFNFPEIAATRYLNLNLSDGAYAGSTSEFTINSDTPIQLLENKFSIHDAYVRSGSFANTNFGNEYLTVKNSNGDYAREIYLKFDISTIPGTISSAKLKMEVDVAASDVTSTSWDTKFVSNDSWKESSITWNNKPASGTILDNQKGKSNGYVQWDVTNQVVSESLGDGTISLSITSKNTGGQTHATFRSKEYASESGKPKLVIQYEPTLSVESLESLKPEFTIYPNPASFKIFVKTKNGITINYLEIIGIKGQVMAKFNKINNNLLEIDISRYSNGIYILKIINHLGQVSTKKFLKL